MPKPLSSRAHWWAVAHAYANKARWQFGKEFENLRSTNTPADHHRAIRINAVNLKHRLRAISTPIVLTSPMDGSLNVVCFDATTLCTPMPQSGRRPQHHSRRVGFVRFRG
jgi:hypothetical protein